MLELPKHAADLLDWRRTANERTMTNMLVGAGSLFVRREQRRDGGKACRTSAIPTWCGQQGKDATTSA